MLKKRKGSGRSAQKHEGRRGKNLSRNLRAMWYDIYVKTCRIEKGICLLCWIFWNRNTSAATFLTASAPIAPRYPLPERLRPRVPHPHYHYYGREIWEAAAAALLCGRNLLLAGSKATGKNVLAENLSMAFDRPAWNVSFHVNMDAASLIGMDTFTGGEVTFRPGPVYLCAQSGGFGILDEINMAKNEALAVLHATPRLPPRHRCSRL